MSVAPRSLRGSCTRGAVLGLALVTAVAPAQASGAWSRLAAPTAAPASGQPEVVVVLPVPGAGLDERLARTLDERVADGLRRGQFTVIAADEVRARVPAEGCAAECLRSVADARGARYLVRTEVTVEGRDYNVRLTLLRADTGEPMVTSAELCEICGHEELADRVRDQASTLRRRLGLVVEPPPRLRVLTRPHGSEVLVDGVRVGVTPLDITVAAGDHDVAVQKRGFVAHRRRLSLVEGASETIAAELLAVPASAGNARRRWTPIGWAALAVGVAGTGAGVSLIVLDGRPIQRDCSGENIDPAGHCKWRHDTLAGGVALGVGGVVAIAAGAALLLLERKRSRRSLARARVRPGVHGLVVSF